MAFPGRARKRATFQRAAVAANAYNESIETWSPVATVWAELREISVAEAERAAEIGAQLSARLIVRYSSEIETLTPSDSVILDGVTYNVTGVRETAGKRRRFFEVDLVARNDG